MDRVLLYRFCSPCSLRVKVLWRRVILNNRPVVPLCQTLNISFLNSIIYIDERHNTIRVSNTEKNRYNLLSSIVLCLSVKTDFKNRT